MGLIMMSTPGAGILGSWFGGKLADTIGAKRSSLIAILANVPVVFAMTHLHQTTSLGILVLLTGAFGFFYVFYWTSCTTMVMTWAKQGEEGQLSAIRLILPMLGNAIGVTVFAIFFDNSIVPAADQAQDILLQFRHAIWFGLAMVVFQILCTLRAKCAKNPPKSQIIVQDSNIFLK